VKRIQYLLPFIVAAFCASAFAAGSDSSIASRLTAKQEFFAPLAFIGEQTNEVETAELLDALDAFSPTTHSTIEEFIVAHPNSGWTPSLEAWYAQFCRRRGFFTRGLRHFQSAWGLTKDSSSGPAKMVADFTLAHWSQLLASLGRTDDLKTLLAATKDRAVDGRDNLHLIGDSQQGLETMLDYPGVSFRCGTFALTEVAHKLGRPDFNRLLDVPSPRGGFTMTMLKQLSDENKLDLVPAERPGNAEIIVPSVIHWKQAHFGAVLAREGDLYLVVDPTLDQADWIQISAIEEEGSGYFLVPESKLPKT